MWTETDVQLIGSRSLLGDFHNLESILVDNSKICEQFEAQYWILLWWYLWHHWSLLLHEH